MVIAFINRPNGDFTFNGHASPATPPPTSCSASRRSSAGRPANQAQDGIGWLYAALRAGRIPAVSRLTLNAGLRYELPQPVRRRERRAERVPSGRSSRRVSRTRRPVWSIPAIPACRAAPMPTDKNNFAPRVGGVWDPRGDGRTSVRGAWGIFYDALAGQGDFFQNGVLAPPFTPLLEVNCRRRRRSPFAQSARRRHRRRRGFPAGLTSSAGDRTSRRRTRITTT